MWVGERADSGIRPVWSYEGTVLFFYHQRGHPRLYPLPCLTMKKAKTKKINTATNKRVSMSLRKKKKRWEKIKIKKKNLKKHFVLENKIRNRLRIAFLRG